MNYLQIIGCEIDRTCVPAQANIFMAQFEKHIYPHIENKSILYLRYIDDIFIYGQEASKYYLYF